MAELRQRLQEVLQGRYDIGRELGQGGMGLVLLARDVRHDREVAIKVLRPEVSQSVHVDRFLREIRIAAQLQHPNILPLIDSGEVDGVPFYVMPYVSGESLRQRLERDAQLPLDEALRVACETADALDYAHQHGVVHRDIKPENILIASGHALVSDFGIAAAVNVAGEKLTKTGMVVGTPEYMSPEQGDGVADQRSDIYSLGCVVFEMLAGTPPYTGSFRAVLAKKAVEPLPRIRVVRDTVPEHIERTIEKALAKSPADRFQTAGQFGKALAGDRSGLRDHRVRGLSIRQRWMLAGAAGTVVFLAGIYALIAGSPFRGAEPLHARFTQLTAQPGVESFPHVSPDGKWIVYGSEESGNRDVYLQSITGQVPINLTKDSPANDDQPAFSPDGERIAFRSSRDGGGIFVMGRTGEGVRRVTSAGFRPSWSPDGTRLVYATENVDMNPGNVEGRSELWTVSVQSGESKRLYEGDAILPAWSPNGERIAFARRSGAPPTGDIWTIPATGGEATAVIRDDPRDWAPAWSQDGRYLYFASDRSGSMNLWRVRVDERSGQARGEPEPVTTPATFLAHPSVAADGQRVVYASALVTINIQRAGFDAVAGKLVGEPTWITTGGRRWSSPDPSPDGQWVAFYSLTQPEGHLYVARLDGTGLRQITGDTAGLDRMPRWSPDGQWLAFFSTRGKDNYEVWRIRPDGSDMQRVSPVKAAYVSWSPDATRFAAPGGADIGDTVWIMSPEPGGRVEMLPPYAENFLVNSWSPDGMRLAGQIGGVGAVGRGIVVYSFATRRYEQLTDFGEWPVWLSDNRRILFVARGRAFFIVDSRTKEVREIFSVTRDVLGPPRLTHDGRSIVYSRRITEGDIWLLTLQSR